MSQIIPFLETLNIPPMLRVIPIEESVENISEAICSFGAISTDGDVVIDPDKCFGCGNCPGKGPPY